VEHGVSTIKKLIALQRLFLRVCLTLVCWNFPDSIFWSKILSCGGKASAHFETGKSQILWSLLIFGDILVNLWKLESCGYKASPCFSPFWNWKIPSSMRRINLCDILANLWKLESCGYKASPCFFPPILNRKSPDIKPLFIFLWFFLTPEDYKAVALKRPLVLAHFELEEHKYYEAHLIFGGILVNLWNTSSRRMICFEFCLAKDVVMIVRYIFSNNVQNMKLKAFLAQTVHIRLVSFCNQMKTSWTVCSGIVIPSV
jgi:hypothetical protein